ncbi:hypothetical protein [Halopiger goleimassiliensis]|uniref:hypothetical protein n=1 Tax=Halopiger goleimassiliensis TaxID=1293048 RepID=UPI000677FF84|nr:hypothetical protein [Halopiger goleimassiliensis]
MIAVDPARVVLLSSLVVLGVSLAGFATVTGIAPGATADTAGEFVVGDDLTFVHGDGSETTVLEDVRGVERLEIAAENGQFTVITERREPPALRDHQRAIAREVVATNETLVDRLEPAGMATLTVVPLTDATVPQEPTELAALDPTAAPTDGSDAGSFEVVDEDPVVVDRDGPTVLDDRALVIVEPVAEAAEYRLLVDLEAEAVDAMLRLEVVPS